MYQMGNFLSTEDMDEETHYDERAKPERKKRRARARTVKRRAQVVEEEEEDTSSGFNLFGGPSAEDEQEKEENVIENIRMEVEPSKPKRKRRGATISRRKKVAWEEDDE